MAPTWAGPGLFKYTKRRYCQKYILFIELGIPEGVPIRLKNRFYFCDGRDSIEI